MNVTIAISATTLCVPSAQPISHRREFACLVLHVMQLAFWIAIVNAFVTATNARRADVARARSTQCSARTAMLTQIAIPRQTAASVLRTPLLKLENDVLEVVVGNVQTITIVDTEHNAPDAIPPPILAKRVRAVARRAG